MTNDSDVKAKAFRALHIPGEPFILANAWDMGSARMLASLGAKAIATSSAAHAFTLGVPDMGNVSREQAIAHAKELAAAVDLPVSGDFENGYGHDVDSVVATIRASLDAGLAGCCIEDTRIPSRDSYEFHVAVERIEAAVETLRTSQQEFVLTARADGVMLGNYNTEEAIRRLKAFEAAGADVLYAPLLPTIDDLARLCSAVDAPVNALCAGPFTRYSVADFAKAGVARISLGSSLARVTHRAILDCATAMFAEGDLSLLGNGVSGGEIDRLLGQA